MNAPLVVNTKDGVCWTRRTVTSGGIALYAPESVKTCPRFVMATIEELAEHGIVGSADALPMPVSPEPQAEERAKVAALIGDAKPATDQLLLEMAQQIRDRREHDHSTAADWDWYCLNASGWLGDKAPTVLRRLLDTEAHVAELEAERHSTNESLSEAAEQLRANRDRITELETLAGQATEFRLWEPGYGLYIRRAPGAAGFGVLEARRTDKGRRCWTTSGWQYSAVLTDTELFCWPDAQTAVAEARRVMPGAGVCETVPFKAQPLTVFRASHDSIVMGLYTTREAAQAHCEAKVTQEETAGSILHLSWSTDNIGPDAEYELHITPAETGGLIRGTGYVVTPLEVASEFDPDGDE